MGQSLQEISLVIPALYLSTQVTGEYDRVMQAVQQEIKSTFTGDDKASFVIKVLNVDAQPGASFEP